MAALQQREERLRVVVIVSLAENLKFSPPLQDACVRAGAPSEVVCAVRGSNRSDHLTVMWRRSSDGLGESCC